MLRSVLMAALRRRPTGHSGNHRPKGDKMDKHQGFIVPHRAHRKPTQYADQKQVEVPRRPSKPRGRVAHNLDDRGPPFDRKNDAVMAWPFQNNVRLHGSAPRRSAGSDLSHSRRLPTPVARSWMTLLVRAHSGPSEYAPCGLRFPAGYR